ncbi:hypothetical protein I4U23_003900 [Adineta vaga]|nr:hypothetical protein I4U23_003900 [Adineta vaga]
MPSFGVSASTSNFSVDGELYIFHSSIQMFESISDKLVLIAYSVAFLISFIQTFWKNKHIDHLLTNMMEAYSDGKFVSNQIRYHEQIITCYRYDQRYSYIPNPKRVVLLIAVTHIQVILIIMIRTLFVRQNELINDCSSFREPYQILQCDDRRDPCRFNETETIPKCTYFYFEISHIITMVTSIITWHYALRYFIVKLIRIVRWLLFCDNDRPRKICWCCCRATPSCLRFIMRLQYIVLWIYLLSIILSGFILNVMIFRLSMDTLGSIWAPIMIAADRICSLTLAVAPELLQNWLNETYDGSVLQVLEQQNLLLNKVESLTNLIDKKQTVSKKQCRSCCCCCC